MIDYGSPSFREAIQNFLSGIETLRKSIHQVLDSLTTITQSFSEPSGVDFVADPPKILIGPPSTREVKENPSVRLPKPTQQEEDLAIVRSDFKPPPHGWGIGKNNAGFTIFPEPLRRVGLDATTEVEDCFSGLPQLQLFMVAHPDCTEILVHGDFDCRGAGLNIHGKDRVQPIVIRGATPDARLVHLSLAGCSNVALVDLHLENAKIECHDIFAPGGNILIEGCTISNLSVIGQGETEVDQRWTGIDFRLNRFVSSVLSLQNVDDWTISNCLFDLSIVDVHASCGEGFIVQCWISRTEVNISAIDFEVEENVFANHIVALNITRPTSFSPFLDLRVRNNIAIGHNAAFALVNGNPAIIFEKNTIFDLCDPIPNRQHVIQCGADQEHEVTLIDNKYSHHLDSLIDLPPSGTFIGNQRVTLTQVAKATLLYVLSEQHLQEHLLPTFSFFENQAQQKLDFLLALPMAGS